MKKSSILIVILLAALIGGGYALLQDKTKHNSTETANHGHEVIGKTFGPGLGPLSHQLSLRQFDKVEDIAKAPDDLPPPLQRNKSITLNVTLRAKEVVSEIADNITFIYWTFNGTVPGPFLRVREGDTVVMTLENDGTSGHNHSIDLHAVNGPGGGAAVTQVAPGENKTFTFKALNPGIYVYHCATPNVGTHMANGMYGLILVEPPEGLPEVDRELYIMQGELYTKGKLGEEGYQPFSGEKMLAEQPEYIVMNGRTSALADHPAKAKVGETVRTYFGNGGVALSSAYHIVGEIFDTVYPEGSSVVEKNVQTTLVPPGGATITDFKVDVPGGYVFVDHALARLDRGAWGLLQVEGAEQPKIFKAHDNTTGNRSWFH